VWSRYALPFGVLLAVSPALAQTNEIRLAWDQSTGANGYRVKWGTATRTYTGDLDVGNPCAFDAAYNAVVCRHTLTGLPVAANSFVAITAYNAAGESGFSREIQGWPRPEITTSSSNCAPGDPDGATCVMSVTGFNFHPSMTVAIPYTGVTMTGHTVSDAQSMTVNFDIAGDAQGGTADLVLASPWQVTSGTENPNDTAPLSGVATVTWGEDEGGGIVITPVVLPSSPLNLRQ
jgi:hypothetical protein